MTEDNATNKNTGRGEGRVTRRGFMQAAGVAGTVAALRTQSATAAVGDRDPWDVINANTSFSDACKNTLALISDVTFNDLLTSEGIWAALRTRTGRIQDPTQRAAIEGMLDALAALNPAPTMLAMYTTNRLAGSPAPRWPAAWEQACAPVVTNNYAVLPFYRVPDNDNDPTRLQPRAEVGYFLENNPPLPREPLSSPFLDVFGGGEVYAVLSRAIDSSQEQIWRLQLIRRAKTLGIIRNHPEYRNAQMMAATAQAEANPDPSEEATAEELRKNKCASYNVGLDTWECKYSPHEDDMCAVENGVLVQGSDLC